MSVVLSARPLTEAAFAPFGEVAALDADRARFGQALGGRREEARPQLEIVLIPPRSLPLQVDAMERHAFSSQSFVPIDVASYLLLVAPAGTDKPDISRAVAFIAGGDQAITYSVGTWHFPMKPLDRPDRFAVLTWRAGDQDDEELTSLSIPIGIQAADGEAR